MKQRKRFQVRYPEPIILPLWPQGMMDPPPEDPKPQGPERATTASRRFTGPAAIMPCAYRRALPPNELQPE